MRTGTHPSRDVSGGWRRALGPFGAVAAGFTTLCCLGVSAAVSLATSLGATFLTRDSTLRPLLAATLTVTVTASALTFWRHRTIVWPLAATVVGGVMIFAAVYVGLGPGGMNDGMADEAPPAPGAGHGGLGNGRLVLVWIGAGVLIAAQLWDLYRVRQTQRVPTTNVEVV